MGYNGKKFQFDVVVADFYLLLTLREEARDRGQLMLEGRASSELKAVTCRLHAAIKDYLTMIAFGEARHGAAFATGYIPELTGASSRSQVYGEAHLYDPIESLPKLISLFDDYDWSSSYGGSSWARIAKHALEMWECNGNLADQIIQIDTAVSIAHNGGLCFDKGIMFRCDTYMLKHLLDTRQAESIEHTIPYVLNHFTVSKDTAEVVGMFGYKLVWGNEGNDIREYKPVAWGQKILSDVKQQDYPGDYYEEEDDYDEDCYSDEYENEDDYGENDDDNRELLHRDDIHRIVRVAVVPTSRNANSNLS